MEESKGGDRAVRKPEREGWGGGGTARETMRDRTHIDARRQAMVRTRNSCSVVGGVEYRRKTWGTTDFLI